MVDALRAVGGCHTLEDFSAYAPEYVTPIGTSYRGYEVWNVHQMARASSRSPC